MKSVWTIAITLAASMTATQALAADCEADLRPGIEASIKASASEANLADYLKPLMSRPRYFESADPGANCTRPQLDHPLYPGIPVRACTYEHLGLKGWALMANPGATLAARWITNACSDAKDAKTCMVRLTAYAWCSNQLSYPVAGNIIEPVIAADGKPSGGVNTLVLHGVSVERPAWMPERTSVDLETQKQRLTELAASEHAYSGRVFQVSRPSGVRQDIYSKYAKPAARAEGPPLDVGASCPATARRPEWLDVSRESYNGAWRTGRNILFDATAKALIAGDNPGRFECKP